MTTNIENLTPGQEVTYTLSDGVTPVGPEHSQGGLGEATLLAISGNEATFEEADEDGARWMAQRGEDGQWFIWDGYTSWQVVILEAGPDPISTDH